MTPRAAAARVLARFIGHGGALGELLKPHLGQRESGLLREICYGVCRHHGALGFLLGELLERPLRKRDLDLECLLLSALHQLRELAVADHVVVDETVKAAGELRKEWARPLVNAVLRNFQRRRADLELALEKQSAAIRSSHPQWLVESITQDWPQHWRAILDHNNFRPPLCLRVNQRRASREEAMLRLRQAGIECGPGELAPSAVYLAQARPVQEIPGFSEGWFSVQDEASQLVPQLLGPQAGMRVLDACAAPGGKTCHVLESDPAPESLLALERDAGRGEMIRENLARLGLAAGIAIADAGELASWWDGKRFDRILLDAPCSATGVIRRHPDIKLLLQPRDVSAHSETQLRLLRALWNCLKPGGQLLYTTCSLLRRENELVIGRFLASAGDAKTLPIDADWGIECAYGKQLLPAGASGPDGFYFCLLCKAHEAQPPTAAR